MSAAAKLFVRQLREEAFDLVYPRGAFWSEVEVEARVTEQPALDQRRFVRPVVVENEVYFQVLGDAAVDRIEELPKLDASMTTVMLGDDPSALDVESGEQRRRAVANVVVRRRSIWPGRMGRIGWLRSRAWI